MRRCVERRAGQSRAADLSPGRLIEGGGDPWGDRGGDERREREDDGERGREDQGGYDSRWMAARGEGGTGAWCEALLR